MILNDLHDLPISNLLYQLIEGYGHSRPKEDSDIMRIQEFS